MKYLKKYWHLVLLAVILLGFAIHYSKLANRKNADPLDVPDGVDIPSGWKPLPVVVKLRNAMPEVGFNPFTWFDDEAEIWNALDPLNDAQLALVWNEWLNQYETTLYDEFESNLSGDDLNRALKYFEGIV